MCMSCFTTGGPGKEHGTNKPPPTGRVLNFRTVVLEKTLESPLDCKEIQPVHPKRNQSWIFIGRTVAEAETPILWPPDAKNWLTGQRPWCWERLKAGGEGDNRGWDGWMASPIRWTWVGASSGDGDGQGCLVCCSPWGCKESDTTDRLKWTECLAVKLLAHMTVLF